MTNVLQELRQWAATLDYWEQAALDKVAAGVQFTDADYEELLQYLLEDAGLAEPKSPRPALLFPQAEEIGAQPAAPVRLLRIFNLQNINALATGQVLTFGPAMTAIYGGNGSGKSGYARVLGCAGFTRGDQEVLPDVTRPVDPTVVLSADIEVTDGTTNRVIHYQVGRRCPDLSSFYVFDSTSVRVHLTELNALSFSPAGLSYLTELAKVTDEVRDRLKARVQEYSAPHSFDTLFHGQSEVSLLVAGLGPDTDLARLSQLATLSPDEQVRIGELDLEIARLKTLNVSQQIEDLDRKIGDMEELAVRLREARKGLGDEVVDAALGAVKTCLEWQAAAEQLSIDQFRSEHFSQTGSRIWRQFVEAARALAATEATPEGPYPRTDSHCLLCQQPLSAEARDLLLRLWAFLEGEAQTRLAEAQRSLDGYVAALRAVSLDFLDSRSVPYRHLQEEDPGLLERVSAFVAACASRRSCLEEALAAKKLGGIFPPLPQDGIAEIEALILSLRARRDELVKRDPGQEIARLEEELRTLQHRATLGEHLAEMEEYVQRRMWAKKAAKAGGTTAHVTKKHNDLLDQLVINRYVELFEQMLKALGRPLQVKVKTVGRKGQAYKQIVVGADLSTSKAATPEKVLSEGEKRAVALADFLTEVALDTGSSGIILDDPVTSLDLEWRELVARILATEAKRRQVIVFTHDLPFLYFLKQRCEGEQVGIATHWVKRGDVDDRPGYVFLDNSPALERDYRRATRARELCERAKKAPAAEQEALLREGFGALRTCYEAFIVFELFNEVVMRFEERISFGRLKDIVWDQSLVADVIGGCERLSRHIEGHLHSDEFGAQKPTPALLLTEIETFEALRRKLQTLRNSS